MAIAADRAREDAYPEHWEADVVLRDGGTAHLRPIHPEDSDQLQEFHLAQSPESVYMRFFAPVPRLSVRDLHRFTHVDHRDRVAFVITVAGRIIGIGRYDRLNETEAEVAFNISDDHQGRGVGSVLLEHLAAAARENGINRFVAEVLPQNRKMVSVFKETGYEIRRSFKDGVIALEFDIDPTEKSLAVAVAREHRSEANSLRELLHAGSVVVIGAGQDETSAGSRILHNVLAGGFTGQVYAIHPELDQVQGVPAYPSLADLPQPVRLALVAVDPETIEGDVAQCAAAGVRGIIIFTSGHAELDEEGQRLQSELVTEARRAGLRLIGPNAMGLASLASSSPLNATLSPQLPPPGGLGLFTQSAGLGVAALSSATRRGIGVSSFLNAGNRADVSSNDMMQYWLEDEATTAAALNLESVGNPRKFFRIARRLATAKPTVVLSSRSLVRDDRGQADMHAPADTFHTLLQQAGLIHVSNSHQMFDVSQLVTSQPMPAGSRVGIVDNAEAIGHLIANAAHSAGLQVIGEPVTVLSTASPQEFGATLAQQAERTDIDCLVTCFISGPIADPEEIRTVVAQVAAGSDKTFAACLLNVGIDTMHSWAAYEDSRVPCYPAPEDAVYALGYVCKYAAWRRRSHAGTLVNPQGIDVDQARVIVGRELKHMGQGTEPMRMPDHAAQELLATFGIEVIPAERAYRLSEVQAAADRFGYPVMVKYASRLARNRTGQAGYRMNIGSDEELEREYRELMALATNSERVQGVIVQSMAQYGPSVAVTAVEDPDFGPVLSFGFHGEPIEVYDDLALRVPPVTDREIQEMIGEVKAGVWWLPGEPARPGAEAEPRPDVHALRDLLARMSRLADELPQVRKCSLDPVVVTPQGVEVLTARVWLAPSTPRTDSGPRRMSRLL